MTKQGTFSGSEITVSFVTETEKADYGVPGSPVWDEIDPDTIEVTALEILGVDVNIDDLPADLQSAVLALIDEIDMKEE